VKSPSPAETSDAGVTCDVLIQMAGLLPRVGFIGLGGMGSRHGGPAARCRVSRDGLQPERRAAEEFQRSGAPSRSLPAARRVGRHVLSSVADDAALEQVMFGDGGALLAHDRPPSHRFEHGASTRVGEAVGGGLARGIDVSMRRVRSLPQAEAGQLVVSSEAGSRCMNVCRRCSACWAKTGAYMGRRVRARRPAVCECAAWTRMQSLAEALALGERAGLPRAPARGACRDAGALTESANRSSTTSNVTSTPMFPQRLMFRISR